MEETIIHQRIRCVQPEMLNSLNDYINRGIPIKEIAVNWSVSNNVVYYWIYKAKIPIKKIKKKLTINENKLNKYPIKKYTYYYYIQKSFNKGDMTKKERNKSLNLFYKNRYNNYLNEANIV